MPHELYRVWQCRMAGVLPRTVKRQDLSPPLRDLVTRSSGKHASLPAHTFAGGGWTPIGPGRCVCLSSQGREVVHSLTQYLASILAMHRPSFALFFQNGRRSPGRAVTSSFQPGVRWPGWHCSSLRTFLAFPWSSDRPLFVSSQHSCVPCFPLSFIHPALGLRFCLSSARWGGKCCNVHGVSSSTVNMLWHLCSKQRLLVKCTSVSLSLWHTKWMTM